MVSLSKHFNIVCGSKYLIVVSVCQVIKAPSWMDYLKKNAPSRFRFFAIMQEIVDSSYA